MLLKEQKVFGTPGKAEKIVALELYLNMLNKFLRLFMTFLAAVIQDSPVLFNLDSTIQKVELISIKAAHKGASLVVFPEAFISATLGP